MTTSLELLSFFINQSSRIFHFFPHCFSPRDLTSTSGCHDFFVSGWVLDHHFKPRICRSWFNRQLLLTIHHATPLEHVTTWQTLYKSWDTRVLPLRPWRPRPQLPRAFLTTFPLPMIAHNPRRWLIATIIPRLPKIILTAAEKAQGCHWLRTSRLSDPNEGDVVNQMRC